MLVLTPQPGAHHYYWEVILVDTIQLLRQRVKGYQKSGHTQKLRYFSTFLKEYSKLQEKIDLHEIIIERTPIFYTEGRQALLNHPDYIALLSQRTELLQKIKKALGVA